MRSINLLQPLIGNKNAASIFSYVLLALFFFSCKKEGLNAEETQSITLEKLIPKIKSWVEEQKNGLQAASVTKIDSLELNLNYGEIRLEKYKESKELIVIPVLSGFKSRNNSGK